MDIIHYGSIRLRVNGSGNLTQILHSLDEVNQNILVPWPMAITTNRYSSTLANFLEQKAKIELAVEEIDEWFEIGTIIYYVKPTYSSYPQ